jgi:hypothetical protein
MALKLPLQCRCRGINAALWSACGTQDECCEGGDEKYDDSRYLGGSVVGISEFAKGGC